MLGMNVSKGGKLPFSCADVCRRVNGGGGPVNALDWGNWTGAVSRVVTVNVYFCGNTIAPYGVNP